MYGWMWGHLPGPVPVRLLITLLLAFLIVGVLFVWVYPAIDEMLSIDDSEISTSGLSRTDERASLV